MLGMAALVIPELERPRQHDHKLHSEFHNSIGYRGGSLDKGACGWADNMSLTHKTHTVEKTDVILTYTHTHTYIMVLAHTDTQFLKQQKCLQSKQTEQSIMHTHLFCDLLFPQKPGFQGLSV